MRLTSLTLFLFVLVGCPGPSPTCTAGESRPCGCTDGRTGAQLCRADGTLDVCACTGGTDAATLDAATIDAAAIDASDLDAAAEDADIRRDAGAPDAGGPPCIRDVDWLLMIDDSNSMSEEQALLATEIPRLVQILASGDRDGDGTPEFTPLASLHVGVVSSDMGIGTAPDLSSCPTGLGDDGILQRSGASSSGCPSSFPSGVFAFTAGDDVDDFADDVTCVARLGTSGCGFEQQLDSVLKAVAPASAMPFTVDGYESPRFLGDTTGHYADTNAGFLRDDSMLVVTLLTDEDDCSTPDTDIFVVDDPRYAGVGLNLRCSTFESELHPIERYVDGLVGLRRDPRLFAFSAIAGAPVGTDAHTSAELADLLADPSMTPATDPSFGDRLLTVCTSSTGNAYPASRIARTAQGVARTGAYASVQSICDGTFGAALDDVVDAIVRGAPTCR